MTTTVPSAVHSRKKVLHQFKMGLLRVFLLYSLNTKKTSDFPPRYCGVDFLELLRSELDMNLSPSTLYPILNEMEEAGLVESDWVVGDDGKRRK
ncbi:MAG: PadR family transcriptional regulator, partial [Candidatus Hodarchaeales archaeon]